MTDTTITDGIVAPQDDGTGVPDGSEDFNSAAYLSAISRYKGQGSYVGEDETGTATLQFNDIDTTNEQVDVGPGFAYITESGNQVQSSGGSTYDTTLPVATPYVVILPTEVVDLGLGTDTTNDLWLAIDTTANDGVYIRHGSGLSAPTDPNVKLGTVDTSTGATTRANDLASAPFQSVNIDIASITDVAAIAVADSGGTQSISDKTVTKVAYETAAEEDSQVAAVDLTNNTIDVQKAGTYIIRASVEWASNSGWTTGDTATIFLKTNGNKFVDGGNKKISTPNENSEAWAIQKLTSGDSIEANLYQNSGSGQAINQTADTTRLSVGRLG